ncbi:MAG: 6-phosphogluconolactonase [Candidatus Saccharimonadales bacterium]
MHYIYSNQPVTSAAEHVAQVITQHLNAGEQVLWLLSGGSGVAVAVAAAQQLQGIDLKKLSVTLTDERYGKLGHADENWQQLLDAGLSLPGAKLYRPLHGNDRTATTIAFESWIKTQLTAADYAIGIFGIGSDGHTAGIKPHTSATSAGKFATDFSGDDFERITITYQTIIRLDEAVIQATGADKRPIIERLLHERPSLNDFPASILHKIPLVTLYTNNTLEEPS